MDVILKETSTARVFRVAPIDAKEILPHGGYVVEEVRPNDPDAQALERALTALIPVAPSQQEPEMPKREKRPYTRRAVATPPPDKQEEKAPEQKEPVEADNAQLAQSLALSTEFPASSSQDGS